MIAIPCPKHKDNIEVEEFVIIEGIPFCVEHAKTTSIMDYCLWRDQWIGTGE